SRSVRDVDILSPLPIPPWVDDPSRYSENLVDMLNEEVTDFVDFMVPNEAEHSLRVLTVQRIRDLAIRLWGPQTTVNVFGSFETKLYLPSSDVDIAIFGCGERTPSCLYTLQGELRKSKFASKVEVIASAKVPILKYVDALTGFPVDVSFDIAGGVQSVSIVKQFMEDPSCAVALKPLVMIIKQFLMQRYLNEVYTGGMGSYAVLSLVAAFLKVHPLLQSGQIDAKRNLGILLIEFLELYGRNFNFSNMGLAVTLDGVYYFNKDEFRQQRRFGGEKFMFTVLDPQDPSNDITRGSYNAGVIRREFGKAYTRITGIIGAFVHRERQHQEWQRSRRRSMNETVFEQPRRPNTILGTILTIPKQVLIHRQEIQERWE
ncbi:uncharacterized protein BJ171DRAFT_406327, partial [Polychytrium aggregatum]|uniref:uncharacterized protein n=1 Tax=Polychytrium aggregatum TaxID=110093 RepID=UPI0022FEE71A